MAQLVRAPPCHGGGLRFDPDPGRFIYANSEPQPNEKYSCAVSVAIARQNSRSVFYLVLNCFTADSEFICVWDLSSAGRASALQAEGHRFEPCRPHIFSLVDRETPADVAQLAEQLICNQQVIGSSPIIGLNICQCFFGR